jgi:hypothetical protein
MTSFTSRSQILTSPLPLPLVPEPIAKRDLWSLDGDRKDDIRALHRAVPHDLHSNRSLILLAIAPRE